MTKTVQIIPLLILVCRLGFDIWILPRLTMRISDSKCFLNSILRHSIYQQLIENKQTEQKPTILTDCGESDRLRVGSQSVRFRARR